MNTFTTRLTNIAAVAVAAVLFLGAVAANAQEGFNIKGSIPFGFNADHASLPAGRYQIHQVGRTANPPVLALYDEVTHKSVFVGVIARVSTRRDNTARAEFACTSETCQLARVFDGEYGWEVIRPKVRPDVKERLLAVNLEPSVKR